MPEPFESNGGVERVSLEYIRETDQIMASGDYDSVSVSLGDFLRRFGITLDDCWKALANADRPEISTCPSQKWTIGQAGEHFWYTDALAASGWGCIKCHEPAPVRTDGREHTAMVTLGG